MRSSRHQHSSRIPQDIEEFLAEYPDHRPPGPEEEEDLSANLRFYRNQEPCQPDDLFINDLHREWWGDVDQLEREHGYIQWLFPIREHGMNYSAQPLQLHEIASMKADNVVMDRFMRSYRMMLDFYGMQLLDERTGLICRSDRYERRYRNLSRSPHNNLRISRILKCMSELGLEKLNAGFLLHVLVEQATHRQLITSAIISSMDRWWANCIRDQEEREWIRELIRRVRTGQLGFERDDYERVMNVRERLGHFQWKLDLEQDVEEVRVDAEGNTAIRRDQASQSLEASASGQPETASAAKEDEESKPTETTAAAEEMVEQPPSTDIPEITTEDVDEERLTTSQAGALAEAGKAREVEPKPSVLNENASDDDGFIDDDDPWEGIQEEDFVEVEGVSERSTSPMIVDMESSSGSLQKIKPKSASAKQEGKSTEPLASIASEVGSSDADQVVKAGSSTTKEPLEAKPGLTVKSEEKNLNMDKKPTAPPKKSPPTPEPRLMFDW